MTDLKQINPDVVICDIVPLVIVAAKKAIIKSYLISNFTWMKIYQEYFSKVKRAILVREPCYYRLVLDHFV